ncbi:hypothetical protein HDC91_002081 [Mucilaginibacter sp. AK015]|nr:hypothetical protein [Mucilaginibacter sp. AK015]
MYINIKVFVNEEKKAPLNAGLVYFLSYIF